MAGIIAELPPRIASILTPDPTDPEFTENAEIVRAFINASDAEFLIQNSEFGRKVPSARKLAQLVDLKQRGLMPFTGENIILDAQGNILDGITRLGSIVATGKGEYVFVAVGIDPIANRVIGHGSRRSFKDTLLFEKTSTHAKLVASAVGYVASWEFYGALTFNSKVSEWQRWNTHEKHPELEEFAAFYNTMRTPIGITASICLAMHVILHGIDPEAAVNFMDSMNEPAPEGSPVGALANLVIKEMEKPKFRRKQNLHARLGYAIGVTWNLYRQNKETQKIDLPATMPTLV